MEALVIVLFIALIGIGGLAIWSLLRPGARRAGDDTDAQRMEQQTQRLEAQLQAAKTDLAQLVGEAQRNLLQQVSNVDQKVDDRLSAVRSTMDSRLEAVQATMGQGLSAVQTNLTSSLTSTQETIGKIGEQLGGLDQSAQQMLEIGRNISSLQDILKPPKLRGGFGELLLERLLGEILSNKNYTIQHRFPSGVQVDAAIHIGNSFVPVDSKFPLEAFNRMAKAASEEDHAALRKEFVRSVRGHIDAVAKYILPDEGSLPFALMYIPAENVYYEVIVKDDMADGQTNLCAYAMERRVIPVSPSSFYAYLQAILIGLNGMRVEAHAQDIIRHVERLSGDFVRIRKDFGTLGAHLKNASDRYSDLDRSVNKFGDRLQLTLHEPLQAPLPDAAIAPAPLGEPALTNGNSEDH
jgi:DNA recombination protein RmuC